MNAILDWFIDYEHEQGHNYFAAAFFAGFRPSEQIALVWSDVDFLRQEVRVQRAIVRNLAKPSTKTYLVRDVELVERVWETSEAQRAHTQLAGAEIFHDPVTGRRWAGLQRQHPTQRITPESIVIVPLEPDDDPAVPETTLETVPTPSDLDTADR